MSSIPYTAVPTEVRVERTEIGYRRLFWVISAIVAVSLAVAFSEMAWAHNAFTGPESVVAANSEMLAHRGTLYYDLKTYPYTVSAYTPILYLLEAGMNKLGVDAILAGRLVSFAALAAILALCSKLVLLYTGHRYLAWLAALLVGSTSLLANWSCIGQTDMLAACFALAAFYQYLRNEIHGEKTLLYAGLLAGLAFFTKQTTVAAPAAIFLALWMRDKKKALAFGVALATAVAAVALAVNAITGGRFFLDTVRANLNPFALDKIRDPLNYIAIAAGQLILVVALGAKRAWPKSRALFLYLGTSTLIMGATELKVGSDSNYQIEWTIVLTLCACCALHALEFFPLLFRGSKRWVTLLQVPLGIHMVLNLRITNYNLLTRFAIEQALREQVNTLRPYATGRMLSTDYNSEERLRGSLEVETLIYSLLVHAGVTDPEPLRRDIAAESFSTIVLYDDLTTPASTRDIEISALPQKQIEEIRHHYKLVAKIPGPYVNGLFVYKPIGGVAQ